MPKEQEVVIEQVWVEEEKRLEEVERRREEVEVMTLVVVGNELEVEVMILVVVGNGLGVEVMKSVMVGSGLEVEVMILVVVGNGLEVGVMKLVVVGNGREEVGVMKLVVVGNGREVALVLDLELEVEVMTPVVVESELEGASVLDLAPVVEVMKLVVVESGREVALVWDLARELVGTELEEALVLDLDLALVAEVMPRVLVGTELVMTLVLDLVQMASRLLSNSSEGTDPSKSLNLRSRKLSFGNSNTILGNGPTKRLTSARKPISTGRCPAMSALLRSIPATTLMLGSSSALSQKTPLYAQTSAPSQLLVNFEGSE
ncbi:hypothetical protein H5410_052214 [Solanum commersonii]|uniref:Uncharacterized protein n=1 Tax=Solanum commersonii TaxID=4109 RepID=A0A9J5X0I3_SOLCO|nr:hypothetical protein H5410_052214 [Solanum commersonii]